MTRRLCWPLLLSVVLAAGCMRAMPTPASAPAPAVATPSGGYTLLSKVQLEELIRSKIGVDGVTLTAKGEHKYAGTLTQLDGTTLPVEVTVEDGRIVCETKTPAGSTRQTITPNAPVKSDLIVK